MGKIKKLLLDEYINQWHTIFLTDLANSAAQEIIGADGQTEVNGASDVGIPPAAPPTTDYPNSLALLQADPLQQDMNPCNIIDHWLDQQNFHHTLLGGYLNTGSLSQPQYVVASGMSDQPTNSSSTMSTKKTKSSALKPVTSTLTGQLQASTTLRAPVTMSSKSLENMRLREKAKKLYPMSMWSTIDAAYPV